VGATAKDNRLFVDAVLYRYRAWIPWRDLPERFGGFRWCTRASAQCGDAEKGGDNQVLGHSRGGLSSKINATVDALGNPTNFALTPGQAHDLERADILLPEIQADAVIADNYLPTRDSPIGTGGKSLSFPPAATARILTRRIGNSTKRAT